MIESRPRLLYIDAKWPTPDRDAASQRAVQLIAELVALGFDVDWASIDDSNPLTESGLRSMGGARPITPAGHEAIHSHIDRHGAEYDMAVVAWTTVAQAVIEPLRRANPAIVICFDTVDVNHLREYRHARATGNANILRRALAMKAAESSAIEAADLTIAITEADAATLSHLAPGSRIEVISMWSPHRAERVPGPEGREGMLFLGSLHAWHNVDAILYAANEILPVVTRLRPAMRLVLAGAGFAQPVDEVRTSQLVRLGAVDDLGPVFDRARMFVCPLRVGSGLKGKILEALTNGLPIVSTTIGAEGMGLVDGVNCLIADDAESFAQAVARLDVDDELWRRLSAAGRAHVANQFSPEVVSRQVREVFASYVERGALVGAAGFTA